jgi:hydrogenase maturation protein HypF
MGRLFDAVAALIGVRQAVNYEAQAAIELEALVDPSAEGAYSLEIAGDQLDPSPMLQAIIADLAAGVAKPVMATRFHRGLARAIAQACVELRRQTGFTTVALSGGVWQNVTLLQQTCELLKLSGFTILVHRQVPTNDGGLALGQAVIAAKQMAA